MMLTTEAPSKTSIESVEDTAHEFPDKMEANKGRDSSDWLDNDDMELLQRIKNALPAGDTMKYKSRMNHINWEAISFKEYSADKCKNRWIHIQGYLRHYRILDELVEEAIFSRLRPWTNFNKGGKRQEHPDYPKKPLTSYMIYYLEKKGDILKKQPGLGGTDLAREIAKLYNELDDHSKQIYTEKAMVEKELFELKLKNFMSDHPGYAPQKSTKYSVKPIPPKAPTPFKLFCDAKVAEFQVRGMNAPETREKYREMYKELGDEQRLGWIYKSLQQEKQYNEDLEKFKTEHPELEIGAKKSLLSKEERHLKEKTEGKPEKPPNCGYNLFSKKMLTSSSLKHLESKERMVKISRMWKGLQDEEKKIYNDEAQRLTHNYKIKHASYLESLQPDQRALELKNSDSRVLGTKRSLSKPKQSAIKKIKLNNEQIVQVINWEKVNETDQSSSTDDSEENCVYENLPARVKENIRSSFRMFCKMNIEKYREENREINQHELNQLMIETFSKLSEEDRKIYETMVLKSKKRSPVIKIKFPVKSDTRTAIQEVKSKEPVLNTATKPTPEYSLKETEKKMPLRVHGKQLYPNEPPKPPKSPAHYYAYTISKHDSLSPEIIEEHWNRLSETEKTRYTADHNKTQQEYREEFENFLRSLPVEELQVFRFFMNNRLEKFNSSGSDSSDSSTYSSCQEDQRLQGNISNQNKNSTKEEEEQ